MSFDSNATKFYEAGSLDYMKMLEVREPLFKQMEKEEKATLLVSTHMHYLHPNTKVRKGCIYLCPEIAINNMGSLNVEQDGHRIPLHPMLNNGQRSITLRMNVGDVVNGRTILTMAKEGEGEWFTFNIARAVLSTFKTIPEKDMEKVFKLSIMFLSGKNQTNFNNVAWVSRKDTKRQFLQNVSEGVHDSRIKPMLVTILVGELKGQQFSIAEGSGWFSRHGIKSDIIRRVARGEQNQAYGCKWEFIEDPTEYTTFPEYAVDTLIANAVFNDGERDPTKDPRVKPVLGTVLMGEHKGYQFVLYGGMDAEENGFKQPHISKCVGGKLSSTGGCAFTRVTNEEATKYPRGLQGKKI